MVDVEDRDSLAGGFGLGHRPSEHGARLEDRQFAEREDERYLVRLKDLWR
jgi:hypothetical protein